MLEFDTETRDIAHKWDNWPKIHFFAQLSSILPFFMLFQSYKLLKTHFFGFLEVFWAEKDYFYRICRLHFHLSPWDMAKITKKWCPPPPPLGSGQFKSIATSFFNWESSDEFLGPYGSSNSQFHSRYSLWRQCKALALRLMVIEQCLCSLFQSKLE